MKKNIWLIIICFIVLVLYKIIISISYPFNLIISLGFIPLILFSSQILSKKNTLIMMSIISILSFFIKNKFYIQTILYWCIYLISLLFVERNKEEEKKFEDRINPLNKKYNNLLEENENILKETEIKKQKLEELSSLFTVSKDIELVMNMDEIILLIKETFNKYFPTFKYILVLKNNKIAINNGLEKIFLAETFSTTYKELINHLFRIARIEYIIDINNDEKFKKILKIGSLISFPLFNGKEVVGIIVSVSEEKEAYSPKEIEKIEIICNQFSLGIEKIKSYEVVEIMSRTDGLTNLHLHRYFRERLDEEIKRSSRYKYSFTLFIIDIDNFKKYNDSYGHIIGDGILKELSQIIKENFTQDAIISRYGGEEFTVILPYSTNEKAFMMAEQLRKSVENHKFFIKAISTQITISIGISLCFEGTQNSYKLIDQADQALYHSKRGKKNQTTVYQLLK